DGLETLGDDSGRAHMMIPEEGVEGGTAGELHRLEGGPATQEVAEDTGIFLLKPVQHVRAGVLEGTGQTVRHAHRIADEAAAGLDAWFKRTQLWALRLERLQLVAMCEQEREWEFGVRGIILGAAGGESLAVPREGEGIDGAQDEARVFAQR